MDWDMARVVRIIKEVIKERWRQYKLYSSNPFNNRVDNMLFVLGEEIGEVNKAMVEYLLAEMAADTILGKVSNKEEDHVMTVCKEKMAHIRKELIQVAAVAMVTVELIDYHKKHDEEEVV